MNTKKRDSKGILQCPPLIPHDEHTGGGPLTENWVPYKYEEFKPSDKAIATHDLSKNPSVKPQEMWIEYVESSAEIGGDPLPSRWMRIYLRTTDNLAKACLAWRMWVYEMLESMLPKAGELNPSVVLPDPEDPDSAEML